MLTDKLTNILVRKVSPVELILFREAFFFFSMYQFQVQY